MKVKCKDCGERKFYVCDGSGLIYCEGCGWVFGRIDNSYVKS